MLCAGCASAAGPASADFTAQTDQEQAVWEAVLRTFVSSSTRQLVVRDSAYARPARTIASARLLRRFREASPELVESFIDANSNSRPLPAFSDIGLPVRRVGDAELAPFVNADDPYEFWSAFYEAYAESPGLIRLSRVGIDPSKNLALVSVSHTCGSLCGTGKYTLLSRASGEWEVIDEWVVLIS
jgi:hypothetical protein